MDESPPPREDRVDARADELHNGAISELAYARSVAAAVAHASRPRAPGAALLPWMCVGPRNVGGRIVSLVQDPGNALRLVAGSAHGGLWRSDDGGDSWSHFGPNSFNGPVGALAMHADRRELLYAGTGSVAASYAAGDGLFRITRRPDGSTVFDRLASAPPPGEAPAASSNGASARYTRIEVDPDDPERFWAASQTGLWRCRASGDPVAATWVRDLPPAAGAPAGLPPLATNALFSTSSDFPPYATDLRVARDPRSADTVAVGGRTLARFLVLHVGVQGGGVYRGRYDRSSDSVAWDAAPTVAAGAATLAGGNFPTPIRRVLLALCRRQPNQLAVVFQDGNNQASRVYTSADNGDTWTPRGSIAAVDNGQAHYSMILELHPDDPRIVVCGTLNVALSTDGGANFQTILEWPNYDLGDHAQHADQHVAFFDVADRRKLWIGNDGGVAVARDVTRRDAAARGFWRKRSHGIVAGQFQDVTVHPLPALSFMSAGGLQDNGSWVSYGGQTWYRCGWADGGAIAIHAGNPRQYLASQNGGINLTSVVGSLGPAADLVIESPVIHDLPLPDPRMRVRVSGYPSFVLPANMSGPFVGLVEQDPRPANAGAALLAWTANVNAAGNVTSPLAVALAVPPAPGALPPPPAGVPAALVSFIATPPPAPEAGEAASALAFGPVPAAPPLRVEGWMGTTTGRVLRTLDAPQGPAANPWTHAAALPSVGGLRYAPTRFAVHPGNPAMVAVSAMQADRSCQITISAAGAPGTARYRVQFWNNGAFGPRLAAVATAAAFRPLARTGLFLSFPAANYAVGDSWIVSVDGSVQPGVPALAGALQVLPGFGRAITLRITVAGAVGTARFTFQVAGLPVQAALTTAAAVELPATGVVLAFSGGPFAVGDSYTANADDSITPVGLPVGVVEVLARLQSRVFLSHNRGTSWTDISYPRTRPPAGFGATTASLPPGPVTSVRFETGGAGIDLYAGTLAGVYRVAGLPAAAPAAPAVVDAHWAPFNGTAAQELPLTLVNDIEALAGTRRLRVATFGRGVYDCDLAGAPRRQLLIRQTLLEDGRTLPRPFPPPIPDDPRLPPGSAWIDHAHAFDIRVDSAPFQFFDDRVDGVEFDEQLGVDDLVPLADQAVYVQVHNRGFDELRNVDVHLMYAPAGVPVPTLLGGAAPALPMPAGLPDADTLYAPPAFDPGRASPWRRVAAPRRVALIRPWEPVVVRFDWRPPARLAVAAPNNFCALVALCSATDDPLPPALAAGPGLAAFIAAERRAALRVVPVRPRPVARLFIRDGVDDAARQGAVAFAGRSPDLIVVQAEPADPAAAFRDLLATRPQDRLQRGVANHVYVRVHNAGPEATDGQVRVWGVALDALQAPTFQIASWTELTPAAAPFLALAVPAGGTALAKTVWTDPPDPAPASPTKALALVATIRSADDADPMPDPSTIDSVEAFWRFFGALFDSDNAALRVLPLVP